MIEAGGLDAPADLPNAALQRYVMRVGADFFIDTATAFASVFDGNLC